MATQWHYRRLDAELGPVGFPELVGLVRAEQLSADDLVREDWNTEWRAAALAVGLFHMAGRQDLFDRWEAEQAERRRQEEAARLAAAEVEEQSWQRRLRELEQEQAAIEAAERAEREAELAANATQTAIDETLAAALAEIDAREKQLEPTRWQRLWRDIARPETAQRILRWGMALAAPNLAAWWILNWSEVEAQRFPDPRTLASGLRTFPVWGECDPGLYFFLLFDVMLFAGVAAYAVARLLESMTDR